MDERVQHLVQIDIVAKMEEIAATTVEGKTVKIKNLEEIGLWKNLNS